jgi:hypothetical protein
LMSLPRALSASRYSLLKPIISVAWVGPLFTR